MNSNGFKKLKTLLYEKGLINKEELKSHLRETNENEMNINRVSEEGFFSVYSGNNMNKNPEEEGEGGFSLYSDEDLIIT